MKRFVPGAGIPKDCRQPPCSALIDARCVPIGVALAAALWLDTIARMGRPSNDRARRSLFALALLSSVAAALASGKSTGELVRPAHGEKLSQEELKRLFLSGGGEHPPAKKKASPTSKPTTASSPQKPVQRPPTPRPPTPSPTPRPHPPSSEPARRSDASQNVSQPKKYGAEFSGSASPLNPGSNNHPTLLVLKEGLSDDGEEEEEEPPPPPPKKKRSIWPFSFGRQDPDAKRWRYLTPALRRELDAIKVRRGRWRFIIVHNSGSNNGNARIFDYYHRRVKRMRNGMAYHFVIGNGSASRMGQIEIGDRWRRQLNGGHVASDRMNSIGIGICLVGDFNKYPPPQQQLDALRELVDYLRERGGQKRRHRPEVKGHKEVNPPHRSTDCPGDRFDLRILHRMFD